MPFVEIYRVNFANGNLQPSVNTLGWPDMVYSVPTPNDLATRVADPEGINLFLTRSSSTTGQAFNSVYVVPRQSHFSVASRIGLSVAFDLPYAEGLPMGDHGPLSSEFGTFSQEAPPADGPFSTEFDHLSREPRPVAPPPSGDPASLSAPPALWAVVLSVSPGSVMPGTTPNAMVNVTCQFHRARNGIRLNTPRPAIQDDPQANLESPLDYRRYQGGAQPPPLFTLEHSFCGVPAMGTQPGVGFLKIERSSSPVPAVRDHRVYSATEINAVGALGVSIATPTAVGRMRVRIRTFSVFLAERGAVIN